MTLALPKTQYDLPKNTISNHYHSIDTDNSSTWRVENLTDGTKYNFPGSLANISGGRFMRPTQRFACIQNNTTIIREYPLDKFLAGTLLAGDLIREVDVTGFSGNDTEDLSEYFKNYLEGGYSFYVAHESGGVIEGGRVELTRAQVVGVSNIAQAVRSVRTMDATASGNNEGCEGVDRDPFLEKMIGVKEGRQTSDVPKAYEFIEYHDRDTNIAYNTGLTVTTPYVADTLLDSGDDQSSVCYHRPTDTILVLSEIGDKIYQIQRGSPGTVISTLDITGDLTQPEGLALIGDDLVVISEPDEYMVYTYVAP